MVHIDFSHDYYADLGLGPDADLRTTKKRYRELALQQHPDRHPFEQREQATEEFNILLTAYKILRDPDVRASYDARRQKDALPSPQDIPRAAYVSPEPTEEPVKMKRPGNVMLGFQIGGTGYSVGSFRTGNPCKASISGGSKNPHRSYVVIEVELPQKLAKEKHRVSINFDRFSLVGNPESLLATKVANLQSLPSALRDDSEVIALVNSGRLLRFDIFLKEAHNIGAYDEVELESDYGKELLSSLRKFCETTPPLPLAVLVRGETLAQTIEQLYRWLADPASTIHPISPYRHSNDRILVQVDQLKTAMEVPNSKITPALCTFWDFEEWVVHMTYQATREHGFLVHSLDKLQQMLAEMIWEEIPGETDRYIAHFVVTRPQLVSQFLDVGDMFVVVASGRECDRTWRCTCGPPLRTTEGYQLSAIFRGAQEDRAFLRSPRAEALPVRLSVQENHRVFQARINAIRNFQDIFEGRETGISPEHFIRVRALGNFLIAREFKPEEYQQGGGHKLFNVDQATIDRVRSLASQLNEGQQEAFKVFRDTMQPVSLIQGPPGTGKTFLITIIIRILVEIRRTVLVVTPTNAAANVIATRIAAMLPGRAVYRVFSPSDELGNFSKNDAALRGTTTLVPRSDSSLADYLRMLRLLMQKGQLSDAHKLSIHVAVLQMLDDSTQPFTQEWNNRRHDRHFRLDVWFSKVVRDLLSRASVVITTISNSSSDHLRSAFKPSLVVIDEGANALEMEIVSVMSNTAASARAWLVVGDQAQLSPFVASLNENIEGQLANPFAPQMKVSLTERMRLRKYHIPMLTEQRRSVKGLMRPTSAIFYGGKLTDGPGTLLEDRPIAESAMRFLKPLFPAGTLTCPLVFFNVQEGRCETDPVTMSKFNVRDARAVRKVVRAFLFNVDIPAESVTVITPYKQQNTLIRRLLAEAESVGPPPGTRSSDAAPLRHLKNVAVVTTDSFQGDESDVVVFNPVVTVKSRRDGGLQHVAERERLCVATSRAKNCMMVVGDFGLCDELAASTTGESGFQKGKPLHKYYSYFKHIGAVCEIP